MELDFFQIKLREKGDKVMEQNSIGRRTRRRYSPVEKVKILREHLENQVPLSQDTSLYILQFWISKLFHLKKI